MEQKQQAERLMRWATRAAITVSSVLVIAKAIAWAFSGSVAMLASLTDSSLDLAASLVTFFAIKTALVPADDDHRFGHGKAEALAGLFQSAIMSGSAVFLILESSKQLLSPTPNEAPEMVVGASVLAITLSLVLVSFQSYVVKKSGSIAIAGDHLHYKGDLLLNAGVVVSVYTSAVGYAWVDGVAGLLIAAYILAGSYEIARPAIHMLMDREMSDEEREHIFNIAHTSPGVLGLHELKTRRSGRDSFIQMHVQVAAGITVLEGHVIAHEIEATLSETYPEAEILIHIEPPTELSDDLTISELPKLKD